MLNQKLIKQITTFVKKEPRNIQDIAKHIGKSWVTADSYVEKIKNQTGLIEYKVFRAGTRGALKIVYWRYEVTVESEEIKKMLYDRIKIGRVKTDFDPFEIYQYIPNKNKRAFLETYTDPMLSTKQGIIKFLENAEQEVYCFSGNNSWVNMTERGRKVLDAVEDLLKKGVYFHIITRVDFTSMENLKVLSGLIKKYPEQIEIRHAHQPLRGFIIDDKIARLKDKKDAATYRKGELKGDLRVFYEWQDPDWVYWLQQVFWNLFRNAPGSEDRLKQLMKIF